MNESGLETEEREWEEKNMDLKTHFDEIQKFLDNDPFYQEWLMKLEEENEQSTHME